jgi:hypothetical protein
MNVFGILARQPLLSFSIFFYPIKPSIYRGIELKRPVLQLATRAKERTTVWAKSI